MAGWVSASTADAINRHDLLMATTLIDKHRHGKLQRTDYFFTRLVRISLALSNSWRRAGDRVLPARLMKNWTMRMAEPMPLGLTRLVAMTRAMVLASLV